MTKPSSPARFVARTPEGQLAECKRFALARRARWKAGKVREHKLKMLAALRAGQREQLKELMTQGPLYKPRARFKFDKHGGVEVSRVWASDITMDWEDDWEGSQEFAGYHLFETWPRGKPRPRVPRWFDNWKARKRKEDENAPG